MEAAGTSAPLAVERTSAPSRYLLKLASDEKLVARVRGGSEQAFATLYERYQSGILSFCRHMLGSREEAEDVVQQSFANAYRAMLGSEREINLKPWLYRIARNQCISALRARRHEAELADDEPSLVGLSDQVAQRDQLRHLLRDLAGLPVEQREALVLAELHDNSHVEVAAILGCEREKVKSLVFQARNSLIQSREAREQPCEEIRRQLSVLRGGALRRNAIRRHLQHCDGCRAFRQEVRQQRQALAVLLPVMPSAALKLGAANAMAAAGVKAASTAIGGGLAAGGVAASGGAGVGAATVAGTGSAAGAAGPFAALAGKLGVSAVAVKGAAATVAVTVAAGGGAVAVKERKEAAADLRSTPVERPAGDRTPAGGGRGPGGSALGGAAGAVSPGAIGQQAADRRDKRRERRRLRERRRQDAVNRQQRNKSIRGGTRERPGSVPQGPAGVSPAAEERKRRRAERRAAARERRLDQRQRRRQATRRKKPVKRPARRRTKPPVGTSPADPAPTVPPPAERGATFPPG